MSISNGELTRVATTVAMILGTAVTDEDLEFLRFIHEQCGWDREAMEDIRECVRSYKTVRRV